MRAGQIEVVRDDLAVWRCCGSANRRHHDLLVRVITPTVTHAFYTCGKPGCAHRAGIVVADVVRLIYMRSGPREETAPLFDAMPYQVTQPDDLTYLG